MKKGILLLLLISLVACVGGKDLYYTRLSNDAVLSDASSNILDHSSFDLQLKKFVNDKGFVNYTSWKKEQDKLEAYLAYLNDNAPQSGWPQQEQFAYYINLYNAATVKLILDNNMPKSIKDIDGPLGQVWLKEIAYVGGNSYSLAAIEKNVLQQMGDPRIHFAINCASFSCPKLQNKAYTAKTINTMLEQSAIEFVNSDKNDLSNALAPKLSEIFSFYPKDFKATGLTIQQYVNKYAKKPINEDAPLAYIPYDWSLNKQ